ncbi:tRNA adenosine(34) deaminase TadA [Desulfothermus okinawensis JCM 13304]
MPAGANFDYSPYMEMAIEEAKRAYMEDEVPVGALVIDLEGDVIACAHNNCIKTNDPTAHAEILAIRKAGELLSNYRLTNCVVICTLEPCVMCMGAMVNARIQGLVFGARDPKAGACYSKIDFFNEINWTNHRFWIKGGILSNTCGNLLKTFFQKKRKNNWRGTEVRS